MAGRPPKIQHEVRGRRLYLFFNASESVTFTEFSRAIGQLRKADIVPDSALVGNLDGSVYLSVPVPRRMTRDLRMKCFRDFRDGMILLVKYTYTGICADHRGHQLVGHVNRRANRKASTPIRRHGRSTPRSRVRKARVTA